MTTDPVRLVVECRSHACYTYYGIDLIFPPVLIQVLSSSVTGKKECTIGIDNTTATGISDLIVGDRVIAHQFPPYLLICGEFESGTRDLYFVVIGRTFMGVIESFTSGMIRLH